MKRNIWLAAFGLLSVFGLFSCSSDKPKDTWSLNEPRIEAPGIASVPLSRAAHKNFPGESQIVFKDSDTQSSTLEIKSRCDSELGDSQQVLAVKNPTRVQMKSLWPIDLLLHLPEEKLKKSTCTFDFKMTTDIGSTHSFSLPEVRLSDFITASEVQLPELINDENLEKIAELLPTLLQSNPAKNLHLVCEDFWNVTDENAVTTLHTFSLNELFYGPLKSSEQLKSLKVDPRISNSEQACRLLKRTDSTETKMPETVLTQNFRVWFQRPKIDFDVKYIGSAPLYFGASEHPTFLEIEVKNLSALPTAIAIETQRQTARIQRVVAGHFYEPETYSENSVIRGSNIWSVPFDLSATTQGRSWMKDGKQVLEILPNASVLLTARIETKCFMFMSDMQRTGQPLSSELGLFYDLEKPLIVSQFQEWNPAQPVLTGAQKEFAPITMTKGTSVPQNFVPFDTFVNAQPAVQSQIMADLPTLREHGTILDLACVYKTSTAKVF